MTHLMHLDASARPGLAGKDEHGSHSRNLSQRFVSQWAARRAQDGIVFVGGSLTRRGGHNPLEPAHFGCAILHGPDMRNNLEMAEALAGAGAALTVATPDALAEAVETLFATPAERQRLAAAASQVAQAHAGVLDRAMTALAPFLARLPD